MPKQILVTGADGFIGSHLTEHLLSLGHQVRALALYNSFNHWGWLDTIEFNDRLIVETGDVRDPEFCHNLCDEIDVVFHLAALIGIPYSYKAPRSYVDTNILGTINMLQAAMAHGVKRFIHTSTSEVYGTAEFVPIDERHPLQPQSPYSASKIGADAMAMSYFNTFNFPVTIARPFNTYGPRQSARAVIPTIITQIASGATEIKIGETSPTRDFNYVTDTCRAFSALADSDAAIGEIVNIGSNYEISVQETMDLIKEIMGSSVQFITDEKRLRPKRSEVFRLWCDNSKIERMTGYKSEVGIFEGLSRTIDWFTKPKNLRYYKASTYNV